MKNIILSLLTILLISSCNVTNSNHQEELVTIYKSNVAKKTHVVEGYKNNGNDLIANVTIETQQRSRPSKSITLVCKNNDSILSSATVHDYDFIDIKMVDVLNRDANSWIIKARVKDFKCKSSFNKIVYTFSVDQGSDSYLLEKENIIDIQVKQLQ